MKKRILPLVFALMAMSARAWAETSTLQQDEEGYYLLCTPQDWQDFAALVNEDSEPDAQARMTADIDLGDDQTMVGTVEHPYQGTFDGQGHTLTVNLDSYSTFDIGAVAPFACVKDATIKNLHVAGSLKQQYCAAGGVAGNIQGNLTVSQCWVSAYIYVHGYGNYQGTIGGIASYCDDPNVKNCEILIEDCIFSGEFGTGIHSGSMMSHVNGGYGNHATLRNCLNIGTFPGASGSSGTFIRPIQGNSFEIDNCYYKNSFGYIQGTQATEEQLADGTIANALQAEREEQVWVQDPLTSLPMLSVFMAPTMHPSEHETCCEEYEWHGQTYTESGTYTYEEKNEQGVVTDIYTLELTIHYSDYSYLEMDFYVGDHYATDMYDFTVEKDGETTYYYTMTNAAGCDSIITLTVTILEPQTYETNATINKGESYEWRGNTYTEAGTYTDEVLTEYGGIKEIYILNLTVIEPSADLTQKQLFATRLADMNTARMSHQIMPVDDGIVVFGGHTSGFGMTRTAERYNFATDNWTQMDMLYYQDYSAGIVTADGRMLLAGGMSGGGGTGASAQCELYDPSTNTFTSTGSMVQARSMATATMAESGKIYVNGCWYNSSYGLECYDPETGSFSKVAEGLNAYHPNMLALRGERVAIADGSNMVVIEDGTTTSVENDLLTEYPIMKGWDEMQMTYYQVADYSYILLGRSNTQAVLLNVYDEDEEGIKVTKVADLPMTLPDNESVGIGYHDQVSRVFIDKAAQKLYVQTCVLNDGYSPIIVEYDYPSATNLEGGSIVVYATDGPLEQRTENAAWTMLGDGTLVSVGGGESNFAPHKGAYIYTLGGGNEEPNLTKDEEGYYLLASVDDWKLFSELTQTEPTANARMIADIDLGDDQAFIGTTDIPFEGTFDGQGHTLTVNLEREYSVAPFAFVKDATIERLHVTGSCYATQCGAAGIVGRAIFENATTTIRECWSSVYLKGGTDGQPQQSLGGIIIEPGDNTLITDCLFDGRFDNQNTFWCGGFANWSPYHFTISNSLNLGSYICSNYWESGTFTREDSGWGGATFDNIYYKNAYGVEQGTQVTDEQLSDGTIARALQAGHSEQVWVQDMDMNQPMLMVFSKNPDPDGIKEIKKQSSTAEGEVNEALNEDAIYNLCGQKVNSKLSHGIYIVNGRKVLVK